MSGEGIIHIPAMAGSIVAVFGLARSGIRAAQAVPERARPKTPTFRFANVRAGNIRGAYLSLRVESPISASTAAMIQKRMTMVGSAQPFFSK